MSGCQFPDSCLCWCHHKFTQNPNGCPACSSFHKLHSIIFKEASIMVEGEDIRKILQEKAGWWVLRVTSL